MVQYRTPPRSTANAPERAQPLCGAVSAMTKYLLAIAALAALAAAGQPSIPTLPELCADADVPAEYVPAACLEADNGHQFCHGSHDFCTLLAHDPKAALAHLGSLIARSHAANNPNRMYFDGNRGQYSEREGEEIDDSELGGHVLVGSGDHHKPWSDGQVFALLLRPWMVRQNAAGHARWRVFQYDAYPSAWPNGGFVKERGAWIRNVLGDQVIHARYREGGLWLIDTDHDARWARFYGSESGPWYPHYVGFWREASVRAGRMADREVRMGPDEVCHEFPAARYSRAR